MTGAVRARHGRCADDSAQSDVNELVKAVETTRFGWNGEWLELNRSRRTVAALDHDPVGRTTVSRRLRRRVAARGPTRRQSAFPCQGGLVGAISITCPTTGKPVSTGMSMEPASFYRSVLTGNSVKCPHCGITHIWSKSEAIFDESGTGGC